mgnify:CR=1 FL=1
MKLPNPRNKGKFLYNNINNQEIAPYGFTAGDTISRESSGATAVFNTITKGDTENGYIPVTDEIFGVQKVFTVFSNCLLYTSPSPRDRG